MEFNNLVKVLGEIRDLKRAGWVRREVVNPESVAEHSYGVALLAYLLCPSNLDKQKCLEYAIIHDLAEIIVGDITPGEKVPHEVKRQKEETAIKQIAENLNSPQLAQLFIEYECQNTQEAKFIKMLDRLDAVALAKYYDDNHRTSFFDDRKHEFSSIYDEWNTNHKKFIEPVMDIIKNK